MTTDVRKERPVLSPEALFEKHQGLMLWIAGKYIWKEYIDRDDILQEARIGLWKACCAFNSSKGFRFSTLAVKVIRQRIWRAIQQEWRQKRGTSRNVGSETQADPAEVVIAKDERPECIAIRREEIAKFQRLLEHVPEDTSELIRGRAEGKTLEEIGNENGVTGERIRQRLVDAFAAVRRVAELEEIRPALQPISREQLIKEREEIIQEAEEQKRLRQAEREAAQLKAKIDAEREERIRQHEERLRREAEPSKIIEAPSLDKRTREDERRWAEDRIKAIQQKRLARLNASNANPYAVSMN